MWWQWYFFGEDPIYQSTCHVKKMIGFCQLLGVLTLVTGGKRATRL